MSTRFESPDQLRWLLEKIGIEIHEMLGDHIRKTAQDGPEDKRRSYPPESYQDQIERNFVYLHQGTLSLTAAIVEYLRNGQPLLKTADQINQFVAQTQILRPQEVTLLHVNYIRYGCSGCSAHAEHAPYAKVRSMVESRDLATYMDEIEFSYVYYQASMMTAANYLAALLNHHDLAGCARLLSSGEVKQVVQERLHLRTNMILDNFTTEPPQQQAAPKRVPDEKHKSKKGWRLRR